jgi:hypothetical protein
VRLYLQTNRAYKKQNGVQQQHGGVDIELLYHVYVVLIQVEVTDVAIAALAAHCCQLTSLRLEQTYVGDEGVQKILAACPLLQELRVAGCSTHSWMLPAEYMFAGLSVGGLSRMAAGNGVGSQLTSLDLSCLAYEPQQQQEQQQEPTSAAQLLTVTADAAAAAPVAAVGPGVQAVPAGGAVSVVAAAMSLLATSPGSSSSSILSSSPVASDDSSSSSGYGSVASAIARLSLDSSSSSSGTAKALSWEGAGNPASQSTACCPATDSQEAVNISIKGVCFAPPLIPADWCSRLTTLSLDWLKVDGDLLQGPLQSTLGLCENLQRLSLVGYQGCVDALLPCVAASGAALTHLNLQHSQVGPQVLYSCQQKHHG